MKLIAPRTEFELPAGALADAPPERRGLERDGGRLLWAQPHDLTHHLFRDLPDLLAPGDLVVVNVSATVPAALEGVDDTGCPVPVHVSTELDDGTWVLEIRRADNSGPDLTCTQGESIELPGGLRMQLVAPYPPGTVTPRLWRARPADRLELVGYLTRHGRPIEYGYLRSRFGLAEHQTVYATSPGSAEMPSAGRPFTDRILVRLLARGVLVAPVVLHTGVSSPDAHEPPYPERFAVGDTTARLVNQTRAAGARVIAVGTTVVRALESAADAGGLVHPARGWTDLVIGPDRPARVIDALLTGLHAPQASHLLMLEAIAGPDLVAAAYAEAVRERYLWHEFGDSTLFVT